MLSGEKPIADGPRRPRPGPVRRLLRLGFRILGLFLLISVLWTAIYAVVPVPVTPLMLIRLAEGYGFSKHWVSYEKISPNLARAAIASEDSCF
jgi:monofunctional biosynthetic peptidoglycan transglycosylase